MLLNCFTGLINKKHSKIRIFGSNEAFPDERLSSPQAHLAFRMVQKCFSVLPRTPTNNLGP